ncbi:flagellar biosynthetic protein FliR [Meridianimarinicoccus sp. RP-17]|uniref:flagellar biosynthetic protein FliR n=1 Tax=Meridianimarinicoccus zhengii TaxID=2056810 RepID=UPI000DAD0CBA|nr:flagellar biosynthetic protein FliR [Phycocomes zhengii]
MDPFGDIGGTASALPGMELSALIGLLLQFLFGMLRIGAFLIAAPLFGGAFVPLPVRIVAAVVLTLPVMARVELPSPETLATLGAVPMVVTELVIGLSAGLVLTVLFGAASIAGDRIATTAGLGFASQIDPTSGGQTPVVSQIFALFLLAVFLAEDGHLVALHILLDSYTAAPAGTPLALGVLAAAGLSAAGRMFLLGMQLMLPAVSVLLLVNVVVGVLTRSAPQLNIFSFGFPVTLMAAIVLLLIGAPTLGVALSDLGLSANEAVAAMLGALTDG